MSGCPFPTADSTQKMQPTNHDQLDIIKHMMMNMVEDCFDVCKEEIPSESVSSEITTSPMGKCLTNCYEAYQMSFVKLQSLQDSNFNPNRR